MQRDGSEKRQMLEVRDLERRLGGGLTPIEAVIEVPNPTAPMSGRDIAIWLARSCSESRRRRFRRKKPVSNS
jgi:hypothetical protein